MKVKFTKMHGCGNDFLFLDCINSEPPQFLQSEIQHICDRNMGIGADGLVVLKPGDDENVSWSFYNSDGSEAEMCGNAARCAIRYLADFYFTEGEVVGIQTKAGLIRGRVLDEKTTEITLFPEREKKFSFEEKIIKVGEEMFQVYCINTGVPHAVIEVKDFKDYPVSRVGRLLVGHEAFGSSGTNVTFFQRLVGNQIKSTTFERGVERQTLACGTGVAASAVIYTELYMEAFPIHVRTPGGDINVDISPVTQMFLLQGPAEYVFDVEMEDFQTNFETPLLFGEHFKERDEDEN